MQRLSEHAYATTEFQGCNAGLGRDEVAERVSFLDRFPFEVPSRTLAPSANRLSLLHL